MKNNDWDEFIPYLLFAICSTPNESVSLSPFQVIFGHLVRGPLELLREEWEEGSSKDDFLSYFTNSRENLYQAWDYAKSQLSKNQKIMKVKYDHKAKECSFQIGDEVMVLLPVPGQLKARYVGPYRISRKIGNLNYVLETPDWKKK